MAKVDIHVQRRDYGYMLSDRTVKNKADAVRQAKSTYKKLMRQSAKDNSVTRARLKGKYFKGYPYRITIMPKDYMKGTVMFEDFGKLPENEEGVVTVVEEGE